MRGIGEMDAVHEAQQNEPMENVEAIVKEEMIEEEREGQQKRRGKRAE